MAKIKIYGDSNKGCVFFDGSTVEPKFLGTILCSIKADETDRITIQRTDRLKSDGVTFRFLFRRLNPNRVQNQAGENLVADLGYSVSDVVDYINTEASDYATGGAVRPSLDEHPNFVLDTTSTTIMVDNGENFGVNTLKAVLGADGLVDILSADHSSNAIVHYEDCPPANLQINGSFISGGPQDVVNALNELFTVGSFDSVVISDPYSTLVADVAGVDAGYTLEGTAVDPSGLDLAGGTQTGYNHGGIKSVSTIDQAGEYFTFDIRNEAIMGFGLVVADVNDVNGNVTYGDPATFCNGPNSGNYGYQYAHWFHPTPNGPWTYYGANSGTVYGPGWLSAASKFSGSPEGAEWLAGNPVKMRVGIDSNSFISVEYYDESESAYIVISRSNYPVAQGVELHLGVRFGDSVGRLFSAPKVHLLEPAAPTMYFRYIESGDGNFQYPLFSTEEEANYYDLNHEGTTGTGTSHQHVYVDDPTGTSWYMPDTGSEMSGASAPSGETFAGAVVAYTEITSLTDGDLAPTVFDGPDYTFAEDASVAVQVSPNDAPYTTTVSGLPDGLSFNGGYAIQGTTRHVYGDEVTTVTVTRTNAHGSSQGTFDLTITDDVAQNDISGWTIYGQNPITQSPATIHHYSGSTNLDLGLTLNPGTEIIWTQGNGSPVGGPGQYMQIGIVDEGVDKDTTNLGNTSINWTLKATCWTSTLNHLAVSTGWTDSSSISLGTNDGVQWKLSFPTDGGPIEMYRDGTLVLTSSANFTGNQVLTVGVPVTYSTTTQVPSMTRADVTFAGDPPAGFTQEEGTMDDAVTLSDNSVVTLDQVLPVGKRIIVNKSWVEANILPNNPNNNEKAYFGVPSTAANWTNNPNLHLDFDAVARWAGQSGSSHQSTLADGSDTVARHESNIGSATDAYYHYAIQWDGTDLTVLADSDISKFTSEGDKYQFSRYSCYENYTAQSGDLPLVLGTKEGGRITLTMSGISVVDIPQAAGGQNNAGIPYTPSYTFASGTTFSSHENYYSGDEARDSLGIEKIGMNGSFLTIYFESATAMSDFRNGSYTVDIEADNGTTPAWAGQYTLDSSAEFTVSSMNYVSYLLHSQAGSSSIWNDLVEYTTTGEDINLVDLIFTGQAGLTTNWTNAIDFSGSAERMEQESGSSNFRNPMRQAGTNNISMPTSGTAASISGARPFAAAVVFQHDGNASDQYIWGQVEGSASHDDNIALKVDASGDMLLKWGRGTDKSLKNIAPLTPGAWYGVYVDYNGYTSSAPTVSEMAEAFRIKLVDLGTGPLVTDVTGDWDQAARNNRTVSGNFFIGGRDSGKSFHGKVASMVVTALKGGDTLPTDSEVSMMVRDPQQWLIDYKIGNSYRATGQNFNNSDFQLNDIGAARNTQVWLMGDGTSDSYAVIRNQVHPADQNETAIRMLSMVSNDIVNVTIPGLS